MIVSRRGLLAGFAAVLLAAGCTNSTAGTAQSVPAPPRKIAPEAIQFRPVLTDGTGELSLTDRDGVRYELGPVLLDGTKVRYTHVDFTQQSTSWVVYVELTDDGGTLFGKITSEHTGEQLAIVVDGQVVSAPRIQGPIVDGTVMITGNFTQTDAEALAARINGR